MYYQLLSVYIDQSLGTLERQENPKAKVLKMMGS